MKFITVNETFPYCARAAKHERSLESLDPASTFLVEFKDSAGTKPGRGGNWTTCTKPGLTANRVNKALRAWLWH